MASYLRFSILAFLILTLNSNAQIAAWDLDGNTGNETSVNATTTAANVASATLSRDAGLVPEVLANSFGSSSFVSTTGGPGLADARDQSKIIRVRMEIECGYQASFSTLDVNFLRDADGPMRFRWFFSLSGGMGGGPINGTNFAYSGTEVNGLAQTQIDLSGIAALQNVPAGTVINFTLRGLEAATDAGLFGIGRLAGDDLSIGGTITPLITTWDGAAWDEGDPDINKDVVINGDLSVTTANSFGACALTVNTGATLTIGNEAVVEVENEAIIDGSIVVETQGSFVQNAAAAPFTLNGSASVNKTTPVKDNWYFYTYWGSPVANETIGSMFPDVDGDRRLVFEANNYEDTNGDFFDDDNNDWQVVGAGTTMTPGVGYAATSSRAAGYPTAISVTFEGQFNSGTISTPVVFNPANVNESWNLIGNPYPCAIDANAFVSGNSGVIGGSLYYWSQATPQSSATPGNSNINFSRGDYAIFTSGSGGTAGGAGVTPERFIPSGQGFFVAATTTGSVSFTNAMRSVSPSTSNSQFFKTDVTKNKNLPNKLWVNLTTPNGVFSQILVSYVDGATANNDGLSFDAPRFGSPNNTATLYTTINNDGRHYAIQGKNSDAINADEVINLGFNTSLSNTTTYTLSIAQLEGLFFNKNAVFIKDNSTGIVHNLSQQDYTFTSTSGTFDERFQIVFNENTFSTPELNSQNVVTVSQTDRANFRFTTKSSKFKSIRIFDLLGKEVHHIEDATKIFNIKLNTLKNSIYIAKIELENGYSLSKKIAIK